jgi:hypothetical protein
LQLHFHCLKINENIVGVQSSNLNKSQVYSLCIRRRGSNWTHPLVSSKLRAIPASISFSLSNLQSIQTRITKFNNNNDFKI